MLSGEQQRVALDGSRPSPGLADALRAAYDAGRARWTTLPALCREDFIEHVTRKVPPATDPVAYVRGLVVEDLYLACACIRDVPGAVEAFDAEFMSRVPDYVRHISRDRGFGEEIQQQLRERLLVRRGDRPARIADYSGRGALASWLRVTAVRVALNARPLPGGTHGIPDEAVLDHLAIDASPELHLLRARHAEAISDALKRAIATLTPEQRVILRLYFAADRSTQQIAAILRVDRSTAARRLVAARRAVFAETKRLVCSRLTINTGEFASLAHAIHDQLDVSLGGLLATRR
jgi:RNA polymerase sigma-70 factor (ECF subfamily)